MCRSFYSIVFYSWVVSSSETPVSMELPRFPFFSFFKDFWSVIKIEINTVTMAPVVWLVHGYSFFFLEY